MANETILRNGLVAKAASEIEGTLGVQGLQMLNGSNAVQYTFPADDGNTSGHVLTTNGSGTLTFAAQQDISSLLSDITGESIHSLSDVEASAGRQTGDVLQWSGSSWNHVAATSIGTTTLAGLTDVESDVTSGAGDGDFLRFDGTDWGFEGLAAIDIAEGFVTQHEDALTILQSQITFTDTFITSAALSGYATESYVTTAITNVIDSAPSALDTLNELAASLNDDDNFAGTMTTALAGKADNGHNLGTHGDVTISGTPANNEVLAWDGSSAWINQTPAELGISIDDLSNVSLGGVTTEDFVLAFNSSNVLVPTAIGDLSTSDSVSSLTDTVITGTPADNELLAYNTGTSKWINQTAAEAGLATSTDIANMLETTSSIADLSDVGALGTNGQVYVSSGSALVATTLDHDNISDFDAEVNALIAATDISDLSNTSITELDEVSAVGSNGQILVSDGSDLVATDFVPWKKDSKTYATDAALDVITAESLVGGYGAITLHYSLSDSTNMRTGTLMVITDGSTVELTDISTNQIGSEADEPVFSATTSGSSLAIKVSDASGYTVKSTYRLINE